jgi:hypothetical protein
MVALTRRMNRRFAGGFFIRLLARQVFLPYFARLRPIDDTADLIRVLLQ